MGFGIVASESARHIIGVSVSETTAEMMMVTARVTGELAEETADDIAHKQQRDEHGDQRDGQRNEW